MREEMYDVLVISDDVVGEKMAGPGIRAWELAKCLSKHFKVILAIPDYSYKSEKSNFFENISFEVVYYSLTNPNFIKSLGEKSKIILIQGYVLSKFPIIKKLQAYLIIDMYVPFVLENLFVHKWKVPNLKDREFIHLNDLRVFNEQIIHGDYFLCANERQKALFVGSLMSLNRINPEILDLTPSLEELISVVPFGISKENDKHSEKNVMRNKIPQIKEEDIILLWGGVISNWFDPITLIKALYKALEENENIKLFFLSTKHPNPLLPPFDMANEARKISDKLKLTNKYVFFNESWVDYKKRASYFKEADIGVSIHCIHFETYYSFRTRILDYLKHELPIICTEGDYFAELVKKENLGFVVCNECEDELKKAILLLANDRNLREKIKNRIRKVKERYYWDNVTAPLVKHCEEVLTGKVKKKKKLTKKEILFLFNLKKKPFAEKIFRSKLGWFLFQKLPFKITTKIRRLFKF